MKTRKFKKVFTPVKGKSPMACTVQGGYAR